MTIQGHAFTTYLYVHKKKYGGVKRLFYIGYYPQAFAKVVQIVIKYLCFSECKTLRVHHVGFCKRIFDLCFRYFT